eukprot:12881106-Prorocentrum_lima.AAC.1
MASMVLWMAMESSPLEADPFCVGVVAVRVEVLRFGAAAGWAMAPPWHGPGPSSGADGAFDNRMLDRPVN